MELLELIIAIVCIVAMLGLLIWICIQMKKDDNDAMAFGRAYSKAHYCLMRTLEDTKQLTEQVINKTKGDNE